MRTLIACLLSIVLAIPTFSGENHIVTQEEALPSLETYVSAKQLADWIIQTRKKKMGLRLLDVRNEADFFKGCIPDALNMPYAKFAFMAEKRVDKSDLIVVYGYPRADHVTMNARVVLKNKGYSRVAVLKGGYGAWTEVLTLYVEEKSREKG
jgi:rhodanese-related sulfurtransferase